MKVVLILAAEDVVGESIVWDDVRARLVWVDLIGRWIHAFNQETAAHEIWPIDRRPTSVVLCIDGGAILGMERHIWWSQTNASQSQLAHTWPVSGRIELTPLGKSGGTAGPEI